MALTRLKSSGLDIRLTVAASLSPERRRALIAEHARAGLRESQDINRAALGRVPDHDTFVDGRAEAPLTSVNPDRGVIVFRFHLLSQVIQWVDAMLVLHSPVLTERYARSHAWFADGKEMDPMSPPAGAEQFVVMNAQPYARKIERGQSSQAPDGVYEGVAAMAKKRFGQVSYIGFGYRSMRGGAVGEWAGSATASDLARDVRGGDRRKREDWLTRQPAIIIDEGR
ncbi:hypothetical protein [Methylobacterium sp. Leaf118]|uniref:hypothetical protein n=1 Tax=Methylobacterium sp. Leaf118 TaxID=2876562 RepID=UPI001E5C208F|nr:hypothetical protein [Methylobacterium sp. Leaf118]